MTVVRRDVRGQPAEPPPPSTSEASTVHVEALLPHGLGCAGCAPSTPVVPRTVTAPSASSNQVIIQRFRLGRAAKHIGSILVADVLPPVDYPFLCRLPPSFLHHNGQTLTLLRDDS
jgi:hypothetical protein